MILSFYHLIFNLMFIFLLYIYIFLIVLETCYYISCTQSRAYIRNCNFIFTYKSYILSSMCLRCTGLSSV